MKFPEFSLHRFNHPGGNQGGYVSALTERKAFGQTIQKSGGIAVACSGGIDGQGRDGFNDQQVISFLYQRSGFTSFHNSQITLSGNGFYCIQGGESGIGQGFFSLAKTIST